MRDLEEPFPSLRGQLLVAHPALLDPNFRRTIVLLSEHTSAGGALGIILNRPLGKSLGELRPVFAQSILEGVPVFEGGPVCTEEIILVAWHQVVGVSDMRFYFGTSPEKIAQLLEDDPMYRVRAYIGHAGWTSGQVEGELSENAWLVAPMAGEILEDGISEDRSWRRLVVRISPDLQVLADAPDDASMN